VFLWVRTHPLFRSWVRIGIGPTHFLRRIVYYCVCIQYDVDKSQISFIELCKTLRTNSGLRAINSCLHVFWPQLCNRNICAVSYVLRLWSLDPPIFYTDLRPWIEVMELKHYGRPTCNKLCAFSHDASTVAHVGVVNRLDRRRRVLLTTRSTCHREIL